MKILNFGSCNIDYVYSLDHIVKAGETETTGGMSVFPGGKGLNQSIALSRAGAAVCHAGCIGEGGDFLRDLLEENGVDTAFLKTVSEKNGHAIIQVSREGENSIFLYPGSNECLTHAQINETLSHFSAGDLLVLQNEVNALGYLVEAAYRRGLQIILNPSPYNEKIRQLDFEMLSYLVLNEVEAADITGCASSEESLAFFHARYPRLSVMLTLGRRGCLYQDAKQCLSHGSFRVNAVDTTAAGDTFTGYFVAGIAEGLPMGDILKQASCAAAISVSRMGAAPSIPNKAEVLCALPAMELSRIDEKRNGTEQKIELYLDECLPTACLSGLASTLGYSEPYTAQLVKELTGRGFCEQVQERRLRRAASLLMNEELSVGEIIRTVGYENQSFFRRAFRTLYGMNPLEYRKTYRKGEKRHD
ncbi:MAG: helix-turn-helix domain-containing protein [Ruminococcaceae bacterium]|nr:helix-turn-helix domain-containing protein [Oscillospiraceae bacterium]